MDAALRGRGHGAALLAEAERVAGERGCHGVWLFTLSQEARLFYERRGYEGFAELPAYAGAQPLILMRKVLVAY